VGHLRAALLCHDDQLHRSPSLGILKPELQSQLGWNEIDYSNIIFAFNLAYALGYVVAGRIMDRIGVRLGLLLAVGFWSMAAMGHAFVQSVAGFCAARFGLGLSEGGNFPAAIKTVSDWFPKKDRALATGVFNAGSNVGALITPLMVPWITVRFGWRWRLSLQAPSVSCG
jgi:ACS family hexuronate transporter-like MFS transporter